MVARDTLPKPPARQAASHVEGTRFSVVLGSRKFLLYLKSTTRGSGGLGPALGLKSHKMLDKRGTQDIFAKIMVKL